jgi:hypothetical protein
VFSVLAVINDHCPPNQMLSEIKLVKETATVNVFAIHDSLPCHTISDRS